MPDAPFPPEALPRTTMVSFGASVKEMLKDTIYTLETQLGRNGKVATLEEDESAYGGICRNP